MSCRIAPTVAKPISKAAKSKSMVTIGMTGISGGDMNDHCDFMIKIPSSNTPRIQESHILVGHIICQLVENNIYGIDKL